eukprot:4163599-Heterocapsa_arctica.AAC.1
MVERFCLGPAGTFISAFTTGSLSRPRNAWTFVSTASATTDVHKLFVLRALQTIRARVEHVDPEYFT